MRAYVTCIGCEQRQLDAQRIINYLQKNGVALVDFPRLSDCAIIVTCAVDSSRKNASLSKIQQISREMPNSGKLIIGGCLPSMQPNELLQYNVYCTFSPRTMGTLDSIFQFKNTISDIQVPHKSVFDSDGTGLHRNKLNFRAEYDLAKQGFKVIINQGCLGNCSYCTIRYANGKLASIPLKDVVEQVKQGITQKEETIMLLGGDTGAYGRDFGIKFPALLRELISLPVHALYIHDFGVDWLIRDFEDHLNVLEQNENNQRIKVINFPIQSGSDRILRLMKRFYDPNIVKETLTSIKKRFPSIGIGTHVIVGFPSETEHEFKLTLRLLENIPLDFITCFPYFENKLAESAKIPDKIDSNTIEKRLKELSNTLGDKVKIIR